MVHDQVLTTWSFDGVTKNNLILILGLGDVRVFPATKSYIHIGPTINHFRSILVENNGCKKCVHVIFDNLYNIKGYKLA